MWGASDPRRAAVRLRNPVSEEFAYLRTSLPAAGAMPSVSTASRGAHDLLLELGLAAAGGGASPIEEERLALIATGLAAPAFWQRPAGRGLFLREGVRVARRTRRPAPPAR